MTEIPPLAPNTADASTDIPPHPSDVLLSLIVAFLAPMFLSTAGGNISFARIAAIETVNAYRAQSQADLIAVAQIIGFGLAALGSLSLAMDDTLSLSMILRLRGNANACNRSAEQNRRTLRTVPPPAPQPQPAAATPAHEPAPAGADAATDTQIQALWAASAARIAAEYTAQLPNLPPDQRRSATMKAAMLSSCATDLLNGPPIPRPRPGELAAILRPPLA